MHTFSLSQLQLTVEWWWYIHLRPIVTRCLAVLLGILSVAVLWSELTFNVHSPVLSLVAIGLRAGGLNYAYAEVRPVFFRNIVDVIYGLLLHAYRYFHFF